MSDSTRYQQLLDATIDYVEDLKSRGIRFMVVEGDGLESAEMPASPAPIAAEANTPSCDREASSPPLDSPSAESVGTGSAQASPAPVAATLFPEEPSSAASLGETGALNPEAKSQAFAELRERALACMKCPHLASTRRNVVFGVGSPQADLMFVGEAPGADEDAQGEPFVGRAGELLTKIIQTMGLARGEVYIGNILKCRPDTPRQTSGNRKPTAEEMKTCLPYLHSQIDLIQPKVLVALGATAVEGLLGKTIGITRLRGRWQTYRGIPLMPTYHPAFLLRNQSLTEKRKVWEDMLQVMEKLQLPISDKQRGYFLKK